MNKYLKLENYKFKFHYYKDKFFYAPFYNQEKTKDKEIEKFEHYDLNYSKAIQKLDAILKELNMNSFQSQKGMASLHWVIFCALSENNNIQNILELGTFDGLTTLIISKIFPNANITTIDLPEDDPIFINTYKRDDEKYREEFIRRQKENTSADNITFIKKNSFFLQDVVDEKFDLIWVDAGHLYPEISWDICNSYHLCNKNGWLMYDDVIPNTNKYSAYDSSDSYKILNYVCRRMKNKMTLFLKRLDPEFSANPIRRKYIAVINKKF